MSYTLLPPRLQLLQPFYLVDPQTAVLITPPVKGLLGDPYLATGFGYRTPLSHCYSTVVLPVPRPKIPVALSVAGVGGFAILALVAGVLAATGQTSAYLLGVLVMAVGLGALAGGPDM